MMQRFMQLTLRERLLIGVAAVLLAGLALHMALWQPYRARLSAAEARVAQMQGYQRFLASQPFISNGPVDPRPVASILAASASEQGLAIESLQSLEDGAATAVLGALPFDSLLLWIDSLQWTVGLTVRSAQIASDTADGVVRATLTFDKVGN